MRVELRGAQDGDHAVRLAPDLASGEVRHGDGEIRVGPGDVVDADALRAAASLAARAIRRDGGTVAWKVDASLPVSPEEQVRAYVEGTAFGAYDPGLAKQGYAGRAEVSLALEGPEELQEPAIRSATVARHVENARNLANRPANDLTPTALGAHAEEIAFDHVTVERHGRDWIVAQGMGAFAAVASGSAEEPQLIVLRYDPPGAPDDVVLGVVGKAITFDSGGISLKPGLRMQDMKGDMAGGAAVIEGAAAIADLGLPLRTIAVIAATENMPSGSAYRPSDVLRASNGKTIEVINTDAEGRLVLADALHHARSNGATHIIDFATLTGAMSSALGDLFAGWFCNDEAFAAQIENATVTSGDLGCRFPLHRRYRRYIDSTFADMKNATELREGGPVLAAMFLQEFAGDGPWAHVDMAGPGFVQRKRPDYILDEGGTGYGVRLIVELAQALAAA
ncbi:MAG TPA: M17 family metallopeptidase [Gaiellaceae bacterium]|jgi:leucyl aminopeptidase